MFLFLTHNRAPGALPNVVARQGAKHAERKHAGMWEARMAWNLAYMDKTDMDKTYMSHLYVKAFIAKAVGVTESAHRRSVSNRCVCCLAPHYIFPVHVRYSPSPPEPGSLPRPATSVRTCTCGGHALGAATCTFTPLPSCPLSLWV